MGPIFILGLQLAVGVVLGFRWQNGLTGLLAALAVALRLRVRLLLADGLPRPDHPQQRSHPSRRLPGRLPDDPDQLGVPAHQTMPGWLQAFAEHQPITIIANTLRGLTLGQGALPAGHTVIGETMVALTWTAGILAVSAPLAIHAYRRT